MASIIKKNWLVYLLFIVLGFSIYLNSLGVPFLFDDERNINNSSLQLKEFSTENIIKSVTNGELVTRPVSNLSFALNYWISGNDLKGYHLFNILIHIVAGITLYHLFFLTLTLPSINTATNKAKNISFFSALLWLVNPIHTQSITYLVQRMNSMATMFYLLSLLCYIMGRKIMVAPDFVERAKEMATYKEKQKTWCWFAGSIFTGLLAIGSKEIAVTLPCFIVLYEWYFLQDLNRKWLYRYRAWLLSVAIFFIVMAFFYMHGHPFRYILHGYDIRDFTLKERLLTQLRVVCHYITLIIYPVPSRLTFDYNFPLSTSLIKPIDTLFSFFGLISITGIAILWAQKNRILSFCIIWFLGNLLIESSVISLEIIFEHRTYLPSTFFTLFFVLILFEIPKARTLVIMLLTAIIITFSFWTWERNKVYRSPVSFWQDSVTKAPGKARSQNNLGKALYESGEFEKSAIHYSKALEINPEYFLAHNNLALYLYSIGNLSLAEQHYRKAISIEKRYVSARNNLAVLLKGQGKLAEAMQQYQIALEYSPESWLVNKNIANLLLQENKVNEAIIHLKKALRKKPESLEVLNAIAMAYMRVGKKMAALKIYKKITTLDKNDKGANFNMALIFVAQNEFVKALKYYEKVLILDRTFLPALYNKANLLFNQGEFEEAEKAYRRLISMYPDEDNAYNNLGMTLLEEGRMESAEGLFLHALSLNHENKLAINNLKRIKSKRK